jgi:hypothetical protein
MSKAAREDGFGDERVMFVVNVHVDSNPWMRHGDNPRP